MAVEIKRGKNGKPIGHWYGMFTDSNGKKRAFPLSEPIPASTTIPDSLKETGSPLFEASRARAEKELEEIRTEAAQRGRVDHLTERLIQSKTGRKVD